MEGKICNKCHKLKPLDSYHKHPSGKDGHTSECKTCKRARDKEYKFFKRKMNE